MYFWSFQRFLNALFNINKNIYLPTNLILFSFMESVKYIMS